MMVYGPSLLMRGGAMNILTTLLTACLGVAAFTAGLQGYLYRECTWLLRILLVAAGLLLLFPGVKTDVAGVALLALVWAYQKFLKERLSQHAPVES
jgi:TRAP-type uncharacterized transport system fused permease subunit